MYKVDYQRLAITKNDSVGHVIQGSDVAYMDCKIDEIPKQLEAYLSGDHIFKYKAVIKNIEEIKGHVA